MSTVRTAPFPAEASPTTSETIETLLNRVSVRKFSDRPLTDETVEAILRAAFRAPTSSNIQAYSVICVRDPDIKQAISVPAGNQKHIIEAPVFLAFCADLTRIEHAFQRYGHDLENNNFEMGLVSSIDASLVGMSAYLAADSLGIKGVMIGAVRNDPIKVPRSWACRRGSIACSGCVSAGRMRRPGRSHACPMTALSISTAMAAPPDGKPMPRMVDEYNQALAGHYESEGRKTTPDSWTHEVDKKFSIRPRDKLRSQLKQLGFDFA